MASNSGFTALSERSFVTETSPGILSCFQHNHGRPGYKDIKLALLRLTQPMEHIQPIVFMLIGMEEVQILLLANPDEGLQIR